jgi:RNA polymerase sigma-70 factor (ECF subfamily)
VTTPRQEAQWILRAQCDDRDALELLLRSVQPSLCRFLCGVVGSSSADDVLQEVLLLVCRKLKWLHTPELFRPWAYRIAGREAFRYLKKEKVWSEQLRNDAFLEEAPAPDVRPPEHVLDDLLQSGVLSPASRAVLVLHFQEELSLAEVAAILEIPLGTVKSRLGYGLTALRKQLDPKRSL